MVSKINYVVPKDLEPFVNCVMHDANPLADAHCNIPLYADGYPGIMFQITDNGFYLHPKGKRLSEFFLYGQTLDPITLEAKGPFQFVVFQLYPFASKYLLGVDPKLLNDDCFDLMQLNNIDMKQYRDALVAASSVEEQIQIISAVMIALIEYHKLPQNDQIQLAISIILEREGNIKINELFAQVFMSERTFERKFQAQVGLKPKQFARIIQFPKIAQSIE